MTAPAADAVVAVTRCVVSGSLSFDLSSWLAGRLANNWLIRCLVPGCNGDASVMVLSAYCDRM